MTEPLKQPSIVPGAMEMMPNTKRHLKYECDCEIWFLGEGPASR